MKHYVQPKTELYNTDNTFRMYAPITGTIDYYNPPVTPTEGQNGTDRGGSVWMNVPGTGVSSGGSTIYLTVQLGHINVLPSKP